MRKNKPKFPKSKNCKLVLKLVQEYLFPEGEVSIGRGFSENENPYVRFSFLKNGKECWLDVYAGNFFYMKVLNTSDVSSSIKEALDFFRINT